MLRAGGVWEVRTDPAHVARWFGPQGFTTRVDELDLRPGGGFRYVLIDSDGTEYPSTGVYREIVPGERIVADDGFDEEDENIKRAIPADRMPRGMVATTTFEDANGKTRLAVRIAHATVEDRRKHEEMGVVAGWNSTLDCLEEHLAKMQ
jgi:uncharacterized protein YndB with AHSA1/START domain